MGADVFWYRQQVAGTTSSAVSTTVQTTLQPATICRAYRFPLPPVSEQRRIAAVLGALDDKIDSNRRLVALLEETAATLFRARFVDFVGVEEFEDSEIGACRAAGGGATRRSGDGSSNGKPFTKHANGRAVRSSAIRESERWRRSTSHAALRTSMRLSELDRAFRRHPVRVVWLAWRVIGGRVEQSLINQHIFKVARRRAGPPWFVYLWIEEHMRDVPGDRA